VGVNGDTGRDNALIGSRRGAMAISWVCLALAIIQVLIIVPRMYSDRPTSVTLVCLFTAAADQTIFGVFTLIHLRLLGGGALPAGFNRPSGAYSYVFFWLTIPLFMVFALVAGLSGAAEGFVFGLQVICLALTLVWPFIFRRMFAREQRNA
jgi:hypothetical protein